MSSTVSLKSSYDAKQVSNWALDAIKALKAKNGSSEAAILKYMKFKNKVDISRLMPVLNESLMEACSAGILTCTIKENRNFFKFSGTVQRIITDAFEQRRELKRKEKLKQKKQNKKNKEKRQIKKYEETEKIEQKYKGRVLTRETYWKVITKVAEEEKLKNGDAWCDVCCVSVSDAKNMEGHKKGKKHMKNAEVKAKLKNNQGNEQNDITRNGSSVVTNPQIKNHESELPGGLANSPKSLEEDSSSVVSNELEDNDKIKFNLSNENRNHEKVIDRNHENSVKSGTRNRYKKSDRGAKRFKQRNTRRRNTRVDMDGVNDRYRYSLDDSRYFTISRWNEPPHLSNNYRPNRDNGNRNFDNRYNDWQGWQQGDPHSSSGIPPRPGYFRLGDGCGNDFNVWAIPPVIDGPFAVNNSFFHVNSNQLPVVKRELEDSYLYPWRNVNQDQWL